MCSGTKSSQKGIEHKGSLGIISSHAYGILDVLELSNGAKILQIRNPWGSGE